MTRRSSSRLSFLTARQARRLAAAAALLVLGAGNFAHAGADRIVVEAYDGDRPPDADAALAPIVAELGKRGFLAAKPLVDEIDARVSRAGGNLTTTSLLGAQKAVDDSYQQLVEGDYVRAVASARAALAIYDAAPGSLAREPSLRDLRYKALIVAARSLEVNGDAQGSFTSMAEAVRSFPDRPVTTTDFDPRVVALHRRVKEELRRQGAGSLEVKVDDPRATVFIDEQFAGAGGAKLGPIAPGRYRVFVALGQAAGRVHEIDVGPGASATLSIDWALDKALGSSDRVVALHVAPNSLDEASVPTATRLARALGARTVVILGIRRINGRRTITGYSVAVESQTRAFAGVQIEPIPPSNERLGQLAALLAGDKNAESVGLLTAEPEPEGPRAASRPLTTKRKVALVVGVAGLGAIAAGAVFGLQASSAEGDAAKLCPMDACDRSAEANAILESGQTRATYANIGYGVGAAALVAATMLWFTGGHAETADRLGVAAQVSPGYAGISFTGGF